MKSPTQRRAAEVVKFAHGVFTDPDGTKRTTRTDNDDGLAEETFTRREVAARLYSANHFFLFSLDFLKILDLQSAVMLGMLVRMWEKANAEKRNGGWFWYRHDTAKQELKFGKNTQSRILQKLRRKKIIKVEYRGLPAKRWFLIDFDRLNRLIFGKE